MTTTTVHATLASRSSRSILRRLASLVLCAALGASAPGAGAQPYDAQAVLKRAAEAMGANGLNTLRYAGSGSAWAFGQAYQPGGAWPRQNIHSYARLVDYAHAGYREDIVRSRAEPGGGGPLPLAGEQRVSQLLSGEHAWNQVGPAALPAPVALPARLHELWTTPHGVILAAMRHRAALRFTQENGRPVSVISFTAPGRYTATAYLNADYLVERVESRLPHPLLGEISSSITYADYRDWDGVRFPARIAQRHEGQPVFELDVNEVKANVAAGVVAPENVRGAVERIGVERAAPGVWYLTGGSHHSVAIEMKDHMIVVESPLYDARATLMLDAAGKLAGKPVRHVVNSHHHYDHAGGLRAAASIGATLHVHARARPFFARAMAVPARIAPDALAKSRRAVQLSGVGDRHEFDDGVRKVEVHAIAESTHASAFLMVYLPAEKLLIEADAYTPLAAGAPAPKPVNANHANLVANVERLGLAVERILPLHGRIVPYAELLRMVGTP